MPQTTDGRAVRRPVPQPAQDVMACSYCEKRTASWCPECFGCRECCPPEHAHCQTCGQSLVRCEATLCAGMAKASTAPWRAS
jgi:hypothetical protein